MCNKTRRQTRNRESGIALIMAIGFLAILSILGAVVINVSTESLKHAGGITPARQAFYTADRAVEYSLNRDIVINLPVNGTTNLVTENAKDENGDELSPVVAHKTIIESTSEGELVAGTVTDIGVGDLPPALAELHGTSYGANIYHVEVETRDWDNSTSSYADSHIDASIVRLFKLDDDQIFRTSGGG